MESALSIRGFKKRQIPGHRDAVRLSQSSGRIQKDKMLHRTSNRSISCSDDKPTLLNMFESCSAAQ